MHDLVILKNPGCFLILGQWKVSTGSSPGIPRLGYAYDYRIRIYVSTIGLCDNNKTYILITLISISDIISIIQKYILHTYILIYRLYLMINDQ